MIREFIIHKGYFMCRKLVFLMIIICFTMVSCRQNVDIETIYAAEQKMYEAYVFGEFDIAEKELMAFRELLLQALKDNTPEVRIEFLLAETNAKIYLMLEKQGKVNDKKFLEEAVVF